MDKILEAYKKSINDEIERYFESIDIELGKNKLSNLGEEAVGLLKQFSIRPAKRIRGALTGFAYDYASGESMGKIGLRAALAIELIQNYLLIIDDVMDLSDKRRNGPTIHKIYENYGIYDDHTSKMLAIDIGLIAQHLANSIILSINCEQKNKILALKLMHHNISITGFGQLDDISQNINRQIAEKDIERMYKFKSGYYTFINPIQLGLALAGVDDDNVYKEIEKFGEDAGIAFQLTDDMIGLFGDPKKTGKSNMDDITEGKYTMFVDYAIKHASNQDVSFIKSLLGNSKATKQQANKYRIIIKECGSYKHVEDKIDKYTKNAIHIVNESKFWDSQSKNILTGLIKYATGRNK